MTKETLYTYLGTNGTLTTPIHLEGIYSVKKIQLKAKTGYVLTKDWTNFVTKVLVPEDEVDEWKETLQRT